MNTQNFNHEPQELFVIKRTQTGFAIHSADNPFDEFRIKGSEQCSTCTCKDYALHYTIHNYQCKHIKAVHDLWDVSCDIELESLI